MPTLLIAFAWLFAYLHIADICFSKFDLLSISVPKGVTYFSYLIPALFMVKQ